MVLSNEVFSPARISGTTGGTVARRHRNFARDSRLRPDAAHSSIGQLAMNGLIGAAIGA